MKIVEVMGRLEEIKKTAASVATEAGMYPPNVRKEEYQLGEYDVPDLVVALEEAVGLLQELEWASVKSDEWTNLPRYYCPHCSAEEGPHEPDCKLAAAIGAKVRK